MFNSLFNEIRCNENNKIIVTGLLFENKTITISNDEK